MKKLFVTLLIGVMACVACPTDLLAKQKPKACKEVLSRNNGYYKEVFMDSGIALNKLRTLPAQEHLGIQMEFFVSSSKKTATLQDTILQTKVFSGSEEDTNGVLLYPDGAPRFRMIYVNGGNSRKHGRSLAASGRDRLRQYIAGGGSYVGTCAGALLASGGINTSKKRARYRSIYLGIYPGMVRHTGLSKSKTDMQVEKKSSLLKYYDFGGDHVVADVRHNGGCYMDETKVGKVPVGAEVLTRYIFDNTKKVRIDGKTAVWAYKENNRSGRVVSCGSHPEAITEGERMELMAAMMLYAMDGNAAPSVKGKLEAGKARLMDKRTEDNNPDYTRIGDRQYHHFLVNVPKKCKQAVITLKGVAGEGNFDLSLCANRKEIAFCESAALKDNTKGCNKTLVINKPKAGKWYVSVLCETTVTATTEKYGTVYSGRTDVLNGVPYSIQVDYK